MARLKRLSYIGIGIGLVYGAFLAQTPDEMVSHTALMVDFFGLHSLAEHVPDYADYVAGPAFGLIFLGSLIWAFLPSRKEPEHPPVTYTTINNTYNINSPTPQANSAIIDAVFDGRMKIKEAANVSSITDHGGDTFTFVFAKPFTDTRYSIIPLGSGPRDFDVTYSSTASATVHFKMAPAHLALRFLESEPGPKIAPAHDSRILVAPSSDPAKRGAIDEIYPALEAAERVYDRGCDVVIGQWREQIKKIGPKKYSDVVAAYRTDVAAAISVVADMCDKHNRFTDIHKYRDAEFSFQNEVYEPMNLFRETLGKLPDACDDKLLDLLDADAKRLQVAIATFGKWARGSKEKFRQMRSAC